MLKLRQVVELAHHFAGLVVEPGDVVVDATAGNGNDTLFLAERVGPEGQVYAFDIQREALAETAKLLKQNNLNSRVTLIHDGHENLDQYVREPVKAVMFNLGYLPGGNKKVTTTLHTSMAAFKQALNVIHPGGVVVMVLYPGHPQGALEKKKLLPVCRGLDSSEYVVLHLALFNQDGNPPELLVVQKTF